MLLQMTNTWRVDILAECPVERIIELLDKYEWYKY